MGMYMYCWPCNVMMYTFLVALTHLSTSSLLPPAPARHTTVMATAATLEYSSAAPEPLSYPRLAKHFLLPTNTPDYLRLILTSRVYEILKETPLVLAANLSAKLGNEIWLKREDLQEVFSFKIRGAYNFMANLKEDERWKGVVTCSAGQCACLRFRPRQSSLMYMFIQETMPKVLPCRVLDWVSPAP